MELINKDLISRSLAIAHLTTKANAPGSYGYISTKEISDYLSELPAAAPEKAIKDCRNCKHGQYNDHWDSYFCYNPDNCVHWNLWEGQDFDG